jgi:hypothetical protein
MDQKKAIELLKYIRFSWYEPTQEFLLDDPMFSEPLTKSEESFLQDRMIPVDPLGTPGHDEKVLLKLLEIAQPVVPLNVLRQLGGRTLCPEKARPRALEVRGFGSTLSFPTDISELLLFPKNGTPTNLILPGDLLNADE